MSRFETPKNKQVIDRATARQLRDYANNTRKNGTPDDMVIASKVEETLDKVVIIDPN